MRILSVSHYYPPHVGGLEVVATKLVESLLTNGHQVSVVTCAFPGAQKGRVVENGAVVYRERVLNFFDTHFGIPFPIPGVGMCLRMFREARHSDAVHIHDVFYVTSWLAYWAAAIYRKPIVLTQHVGLVEHKSSFVMGVQRVVYRLFGRTIFSAAHTIIVYNRNVKDFLVTQGVDIRKIMELRNGIEFSNFSDIGPIDRTEVLRSFGVESKKPIVLFVGRFVAKKGVDILFGAHDDRYDIIFAGSGNIPSEWINQKGVYFIGPFSRTQLAQLYHASDVFVFPAAGEIFTLVMQEAMASGLPIITTDDSGYYAYEVDRTLIKFVTPESSVLKREIINILDDRDLAVRMGAYSRDLASRWFDWDANIQPILTLYKNL